MGLDRTIRFASGGAPNWEAVVAQLRRVGLEASLRMIDGLPAFPDELPEETWEELRVGFAAGMVTLRSGPDHLSCVVWGNAEGPLKQSWDALCWACASACGGKIESPAGPVSADEFARAAGLDPS